MSFLLYSFTVPIIIQAKYLLLSLLLWLPFCSPTQAQGWRDAQCETSVLANGRWMRIAVDTAGVYRMSDSWLRKQGFANPEKVHVYGYGGHVLSQRFGDLPDADLHLTPQYRQTDGILFYARGTVSWAASDDCSYYIHRQNPYATQSYYFISDRDTSEQLEKASSLPSQEATLRLTTFEEHILYEKEAYSWGKTGQALYDSYDYANGPTRTYQFSLPGLVSEAKGSIHAAFAARQVSTSPTYFSIEADGIELGRATIPGLPATNQYYNHGSRAELHVPWLGSKSTTLKLTGQHSRPTGISGRLDYITVEYHRQIKLTKKQPSLVIHSLEAISRPTTYVLEGADEHTVVWDVTNPTRTRIIKGGTLKDGRLEWTIQHEAMPEMVAVNVSSNEFPEPRQAILIGNQNLHGMPSPTLVIITPDRSDFKHEAQRLAAYHEQHDGVSVHVVNAQEIYNEFSSGVPDATAYRRLLKMWYDRNAASPPRYLILLGDASFDNRMLTSTWSKENPADYLLSFQSAESLKELDSYVTDDYFGLLDDEEGEDLIAASVDIGIGRIPVRTREEARTVIDKIITYAEDRNPGKWKMSMCFVADDGDRNLFAEQAETLVQKIEKAQPAMHVERLYADMYPRETTASGASYPQANERLLEVIDNGLSVLHYTGHGSSSAWASEHLLTQEEISNLRNDHLPLWITSTCDFTRYDSYATSAGEDALLNGQGGAIALFTTTRAVGAGENALLNQALVDQLNRRSTDGRMPCLGDMIRQVKRDPSISTLKNKLSFTLIGDPLLRIHSPTDTIIIDQIDDIILQETDRNDLKALPQLKAGDEVIIRGHVSAGKDDFTPFNGLLYTKVYDSKTEERTQDNLGEGAFTYQTHNRTLHEGTDSIKDNSFTCKFRIPLDINYSNLRGLISLYAYGDGREASGWCQDFVIGSSSNIEEDANGPEISLLLNSETFQDGGIVNETPHLIAKLSDPYGINTTDAGVGHHISLCIDDSPSMTYNLNKYYTPTINDYTHGTVHFTLPTLTSGRHTLTLRAWNLLNRMSQQSIEFEVQEGLPPTISGLYCTDSPAREKTTFRFKHDRPGTRLHVRFYVYDTLGRMQWFHDTDEVTDEDTYSVTWNLCSFNGKRVSPGVYLYHAVITDHTSQETTRAQKLLVLIQ